jgi:hypothetical protein
MTSDTLLLDDSLAPNSTYTYRAYRMRDTAIIDSSLTVQLTTLDTASHDFFWTVDTLGSNGSYLRDVAIIAADNVWSVGLILVQGDPEQYNVMRWEGQQWVAVRVLFPVCDNNGNEVGTAPFECTAVFAFSSTDVWLTSGGSFVHWNGAVFARRCLTPGTINGELLKVWGTSSGNLFAVGRNGTIIRYNGSTWQRMESGTDVDLLDVWGSPDGSIVWACGWEDFEPTVLLRYLGGTWETVYEDPFPFSLRQDSLSGILASLWTPGGNRLYVASHLGPYKCRTDTRGEGNRFSFTSGILPGFPFRIRGNAANDFIIVGEYSMVAHFNGVKWRYYVSLTDNSRRLRSVAQSGEDVFAVGETLDFLSRALVIRGRR